MRFLRESFGDIVRIREGRPLYNLIAWNGNRYVINPNKPHSDKGGYYNIAAVKKVWGNESKLYFLTKKEAQEFIDNYTELSRFAKEAEPEIIEITNSSKYGYYTRDNNGSARSYYDQKRTRNIYEFMKEIDTKYGPAYIPCDKEGNLLINLSYVYQGSGIKDIKEKEPNFKREPINKDKKEPKKIKINKKDKVEIDKPESKEDNLKEITGNGRINFEDDLVKVFNSKGEEIYKGLEDYEPYKEENWRYNSDKKRYEYKDLIKIRVD